LLAFARGGRYEVRPVNLNDTVDEVVRLLSRTIDKAISIETYLADDLAAVEGDAAQLQQMLLNLCLNARDAMPAGGQLTIETANITLDEEYARTHLDTEAGDYVLLTVSDTGMGMDDETQAHIFEPFFSTKKERSGEKHSGLGLAMVYGIVKRSGGNIWCYSEEGQGTTFKAYLPRVDEPAEPAPTQRGAQELPGGTETILVVEDEEQVRDIAVRILEELGYQVIQAGDGKEALERAQRQPAPIHRLLTDVVMPRMSGRELADRICEIRPGIKVLYMSGYADNAIVRHGVLEPGTAFIQKPFTPNGLARKIREVLEEL